MLWSVYQGGVLAEYLLWEMFGVRTEGYLICASCSKPQQSHGAWDPAAAVRGVSLLCGEALAK